MDSIWQKEVNLPVFPTLEGELKTDVLIIGGGMAGVLTAYMLHQQGVDYALVEADRVFCGVSGKTTAKITAQHGLIYQNLIRQFGQEQARLYYDANINALKAYQELAERIPCDFQVRDNVVYTQTNRPKVEQEMDALNRLRIPAEYADELPIPVCSLGAVRMKAQAQFHPLKFAAGILPGLKIFEGTRVLCYDGTGVVTNRGNIRAGKIIVATHFPIFNKHGGYFLKLYQHRSYVLALKNAPELDGMYVDESEKGLSFRQYGQQLLLGGGSHRTGKKGGSWQELRDFAGEYYPKAEETAHWANQDCMSLDGMPYIGRYGRNAPWMYVATGFHKWGMTGAMVAAQLLSDLVVGRENPYENLFRPSRSILRPQLAINGVASLCNLLMPTRPRCPHLGCALKWNPQERSWDCPCHGSRFSEKGKLLTNPANGDLKSPP